MQQKPLHPKVVLGIAAHPDDLDCNAGGTLASFARQGATVHYLILTDGGKGSADRTMTTEKLINIRQQEQQSACRAAGLDDVFFCAYQDGCLENTRAVRRDIVKIIRHVKPDVVVTWDPAMIHSARRGMVSHADHRAAGQAALDAVYPLARDHMSFPELLTEGYEPHKTPTVLLINFNTPNYTVDIAGTLETKLASITAHASQLPDAANAKAMFTAHAEDDARASGIDGLRYAESFVRIDIDS